MWKAKGALWTSLSGQMVSSACADIESRLKTYSHAPSKCSTDEPCPELVEATCPCGHSKQRTRCGSCNARPESNGGVKLSCLASCATAQRNAALAEALGISKDRAAGTNQLTTWSPDLLAFYAENAAWAKNIEQIITEFIGSPRATHLFQPMKYLQRKFVHDLAEKFKLRSESLDEEPFRSVLIARKPESAAPKPSLSEAWLANYKASHPTISSGGKKAASAHPAAAPQVSKQELNCLYLEACFGYDEQSLKEAIAPAMGGAFFDVRWIVCYISFILATWKLT